MVSQLNPACAPSRTRNSNSSRSSCTGTPHSTLWYRTYRSPFAHGQRSISAPTWLDLVAHLPQFGHDPLPPVVEGQDTFGPLSPPGPFNTPKHLSQFYKQKGISCTRGMAGDR